MAKKKCVVAGAMYSCRRLLKVCKFSNCCVIVTRLKLSVLFLLLDILYPVVTVIHRPLFILRYKYQKFVRLVSHGSKNWSKN